MSFLRARVSIFLGTACCAVVLFGSGCTNRIKTNAVSNIKTKPTEAPRVSLRGDSRDAVIAEVTFQNSEIFEREFLYGTDLQYSAIHDSDYDLTLQSLALGHLNVSFKVVGTKLQLVQDQSMNFESDVNHPEKLIHEFTIVRQDDESVTVLIERASPQLVTILDGSSAGKERASWLRSVEFVNEGNYLLLESSVESAGGSVMEFMESVFPRDTLVPANYEAMIDDPGLGLFGERFRFITNNSIFINSKSHGRIQTNVVNRYNLSSGKTLDWYVTANIPDTFLPEIQMGIEGWNRYSQQMWGRDFIKFKGKLPSNIKLGDPRYNVVNWDNVKEAGAAYESQASDTVTGIQSHSLIYLPLAWVNIGKSYWNKGEFSESQKHSRGEISKILAKRSFMGAPLTVNCLDDATQHISLEARQNPGEFARTLLKGVLLHEVGHALGLAHNFKGSLSWNPDAADSAVTTSVMDYNQYNIERQVFDSVDSANGPLLEYDRQILSAIYEKGEHIAETDAVVPTCNDDETDSVASGVDPLCVRYDAGFDPTLQTERIIELLKNSESTLGRTQSLARSFESVLSLLGDASVIDSQERAESLMEAIRASLTGLAQFYLVSGAGSLAYMTQANFKSLRLLEEGVLPAPYDAEEMRKRALASLNFVATMTALPEASQKALSDVIEKTRQWLGTTTYMQGLELDKEKALSALIKPLDALVLSLQGSGAILTRLRTRVLGELKHIKSAPFYYSAGLNFDMEDTAANILEQSVITKIGTESRQLSERATSIGALLSFASTESGDLHLANVRKALATELLIAQDTKSRMEVRSLLKLLN